MGTKPNPGLFCFSHGLDKARKVPSSCPNLPQLGPGGTSLKCHVHPATHSATHRVHQVPSPRCQLCPRGHPRATGLSQLLAPCLRASPPPLGATADPGLQSREPGSPHGAETDGVSPGTSGRTPLSCRRGSGGEHPWFFTPVTVRHPPARTLLQRWRPHQALSCPALFRPPKVGVPPGQAPRLYWACSPLKTSISPQGDHGQAWPPLASPGGLL